MTPRLTRPLGVAVKALLAVTATITFALPIVLGAVLTIAPRAHAQTDGPKFQSVTLQAGQPGGLPLINISPDNFSTKSFSVRDLAAFAFDVQGSLISGPGTLEEKYDLDAKAPGAFSAGYVAVDKARAMVRSLLADQFALQAHRETRSVSAYLLTEGTANANLRPARPAELGPLKLLGPTSIEAHALRLDDFVELLSQRLGHPVLDQTGLTQTYTFTLDWKTAGATPVAPDSNPSPEVLAGALQNQLGLNLQPLQDVPAEVLVVDRLESPQHVAAARQPAPMEPALFDAYVGHYAFPGNMVMTVSRDGGRFLTQLTGQPPVEIFNEGQRNFFANVVDAQISFAVDSEGKTTGLVLHQNGMNLKAPRIDDAAAKRIDDALQAKVHQQAATPGTEQALRANILGLAAGQPPYQQMSDDLAKLTRQQLPNLRQALASQGALLSLKFKNISPAGMDVYVAQFEHGTAEWQISLSADGKINALMVHF